MRAVADTNVLIAAVLAPDGRCGRLLLAATEGRWRLVASPRLLDEPAEVLSRRKFRRWLTTGEAATSSALCPASQRSTTST